MHCMLGNDLHRAAESVMATMVTFVGCILHLLLISIFSTVLGDLDTVEYLKREHSLVKPYQSSGMNIPMWDITGSTMVTNSYIRLTSDHQSKSGAIWNSQAVFVRNWELHVQFKVHGTGRTLYGDGFSVWYVRDRMQLGSVFGSRDQFSGLAIFLDTYSNHNGPHNHIHPYISAMINNGTLSYDHDADGTHTELSGCEAQFRNKDYDTFISIRYQENTLKVFTDIENKNNWKECFSVDGVHLPTGYFIGASAATGELADNHDIIAMKLYELDDPGTVNPEDYQNIIPSAEHYAEPREHIEDQPAPWSALKIFLVIILLIIVFVVAGIVALYLYQRHQEGNRKRFY